MRQYYWGTEEGLLEPISLNYVCFGALWFEEDHQRIIVGYAFGQAQIEALHHFASPSTCEYCKDRKVIYEIYHHIRDRQQLQDWAAHRRFSWRTAFKKPWKDVATGWYVIRSRNTYPLHLSVIRKQKFQLWLEHTAVCENEAELLSCIEKVNATHHVDLKLLET